MRFRSSFPVARNVAAALTLFSFQQVHAQEASAVVFQRYQAVEPTVDKAAKEVQDHHFDEAKKLLEPVLRQVPDHARAHLLLAMMAYESRDFTGALGHIETSERSLNDLNQRYTRLLADMKTKDEAEARDTQTLLDNIKGGDFDGATDIVSSNQFRLNSLEAKKGGIYSHGTPFAIPSTYSFLHGNCLYRLGRASEAAAQYQLAVHSDPTNARAWNNLINIYREAKDFDQARKTLAKAEAAGVVIQPKLKQSVLEG